MRPTLKTIGLTGCDFQVIATREGMEAAGLEIKTRYDEELEETFLAGYYLVKGDFSYYCEGCFPVLSTIVEIY